MSRARHLALVATATLPLLVVTALAGLARTPVAVGAALWALGVVLAAELLRRRAEPLTTVVGEELGATTSDQAVQRIHELGARQHRLDADNRRLQLLVEDLSKSLGEGLVVVDRELRIRLVNPAALRFCGIDAVTPGAQLVEILRDPAALELLGQAAAGRSTDPVLLHNPRGLWELRAFPVSDGGAVALVSDVGQVRQAAEYRRRFVQDLSHELRSPLAALRTTVEALADELPEREVELVVRQVERIDRLARELDELVSIENGVVELELEPVSVVAVARTVLADFTPEAERARVTILARVGDSHTVRCDRRGLYRVLSNLVDNAVKYNRPGGEVRLSSETREGRVTIAVEDTGEGIPSDELAAVVQRFYRVDRARTPGQSGLGLGLAIVKHLVQHMGGQLELDSREGVGTRVAMSFPEANGNP